MDEDITRKCENCEEIFFEEESFIAHSKECYIESKNNSLPFKYCLKLTENLF